jgi:hypothetical protein
MLWREIDLPAKRGAISRTKRLLTNIELVLKMWTPSYSPMLRACEQGGDRSLG